jgi:hypothetical protein
MNRKQFEEYLLLYGTNMNEWPQEIRQAGLEALESSAELQAFYQDHDNFEKLLHTRRYEEPAGNFAQRIISVSSQQTQKDPFSLRSLIAGLIDEFHIPRPALALISLVMLLALTIGFTIGFTNPNGSSVLNNTEEPQLQAFLFDEGDVI